MAVKPEVGLNKVISKRSKPDGSRQRSVRKRRRDENSRGVTQRMGSAGTGLGFYEG